MKYIIAIAMVFMASSAHALGISNECAPELNAKISGTQNDEDRHNGYRNGDSITFSIGIRWKLGLGDSCNQLNTYRIKTQRERAEQERIESMRDKIRICRDFEAVSAPASIIHFCGDLLQ